MKQSEGFSQLGTSMPARILFPFVGDTIGGSHISALTLIEELRKIDGLQPVIGLHQLGPLSELLDRRGLPYCSLPALKSRQLPKKPTRFLTSLASAMPSLANFLRQKAIWLVHTNDNRMHSLWLLPSKMAGTKIVWHRRNPVPSRRDAYCAMLADSILTVSRYCVEKSHPMISRRARILYNPVLVGQYWEKRTLQKEKLLKLMGYSGEADVVGYVSNFTERKRPLDFVHAAKRITSGMDGERPTLFPMFGDLREDWLNRVVDMAKQFNLTDRCFPLGAKVPIEPWLAGMDVFVAPAINEGFGRTLVEAMLSGTPVVASADGGHTEIIEHERTGLLVSPGDHQGYADAVMSLLSNPEFAERMAQQAFESARSRFSVERHCNEVLDVYRDLYG